jgi:acylphosphatase
MGDFSNDRLECIVKGVVQGVGFRWFVVRSAAQLNLTGWTANEADGSVRVVAEGATSTLDELERMLHEGPAGARVTDVQATRLAATGEFSNFSIRSGAHRGD